MWMQTLHKCLKKFIGGCFLHRTEQVSLLSPTAVKWLFLHMWHLSFFTPCIHNQNHEKQPKTFYIKKMITHFFFGFCIHSLAPRARKARHLLEKYPPKLCPNSNIFFSQNCGGGKQTNASKKRVMIGQEHYELLRTKMLGWTGRLLRFLSAATAFSGSECAPFPFWSKTFDANFVSHCVSVVSCFPILFLTRCSDLTWGGLGFVSHFVPCVFHFVPLWCPTVSKCCVRCSHLFWSRLFLPFLLPTWLAVCVQMQLPLHGVFPLCGAFLLARFCPVDLTNSLTLSSTGRVCRPLLFRSFVCFQLLCYYLWLWQDVSRLCPLLCFCFKEENKVQLREQELQQPVSCLIGTK